MSTIDWSATAAWITMGFTLVVSIIMPLFTAIINNLHACKIQKLQNQHEKEMKELEIFHQKRFDALSAYLVAASSLRFDAPIEETADYQKALGNVLLYLPEELYQSISKFEYGTSFGYSGRSRFNQLAKDFSNYDFTTKQKL